MKLKYTVSRDSSSHQYHHINLRIYSAVQLDRSSPQPVVSFSWQGDRGNSGWYAFKAESQSDNTRDGAEWFSMAASIMRKLTKADESADFSRDNPAKVIEAIGAERVVNDCRVNAWIAPEDCKPSDWQRYMAMDNGSCCVSVCAPDQETASKMLFAEFAEHISNAEKRCYCGKDYYQQKLESWIASGKPIEVSRWDKAPDVRPLDEILKPMKEPIAEVAIESAA